MSRILGEVTSEMVVREAQHQDLDQVVALWTHLMAHHQSLNARLYQTEDHSQATYRTFVARQVTSDIGLVLVAEDDEVNHDDDNQLLLLL